MKHLSGERLGAYLDGALDEGAREEVERHLEECAECRRALERADSLDRSLSEALAHDPGEEYFETFAARVEDRLRAEGLRGAQSRTGDRAPRLDLGAWFRSPRRLTMVVSVAVVVVAAGVVLLVSRESPLQNLRSPEIAGRLDQRAAAPTPAPSPAPAGGARATTPIPANAAREPATPAAGEAPETAVPAPSAEATGPAAGGAATERVAGRRPEAAAGRAYEVRTTPGGEVVPVGPSPAAKFAQPPKAAAPAPAGESVRVDKSVLRAQPMRESEAAAGTAAVARPSLEFRSEAAAPVRLCVTVRDARGSPVSGAQVAVLPDGVSGATDPAGGVCLAVTAGRRTVSVLAVGYTPWSGAVAVDSSKPDLEVRLVPTDVLGTGRPAAGALGYSTAPEGRLMADPFAGLPDSTRARVRQAEERASRALAARSAAGLDAAASEWERLVRSLEGGAFELPARHELAAARYHAWSVESSDVRARRAVEALEAYLSRAPAGDRRREAQGWLDEVRP